MTQRHRYQLFAAAIVLIPAAVVLAWWYQWPKYERSRRLAKAEQAVASDNLETAEELLRGLTKEDPDQLRPQWLYAQVLRRQAKTRDAGAALERAKALGLPEADARREFGLLKAAK